MGFWGYKIVQNDYVLDDLGAFRTYQQGRRLEDRLSNLISCNDYYNGAYTVCGIILRSLGLAKQETAMLQDSAEETIITKLSQGVYDADLDKVLFESSDLYIESCNISLKTRASLLKQATEELSKYILTSDGGQKINKNSRSNVEKYNAMLTIYKIAMNALKDNLSNVIKPLVISDKQLKWIVDAKHAYLYKDEMPVLDNESKALAAQYVSTTAKSTSALPKVMITNVHRDKAGRKIIGYTIVDEKGATKNITADDLKSTLRAKKLELVNGILTSDNRIMIKKKR